MTVVLAPASTLLGFILEAETLAPVEGALVRVFHGAEGDAQVEVVSGSNGAYSAPNLTAGEAGFLVISTPTPKTPEPGRGARCAPGPMACSASMT